MRVRLAVVILFVAGALLTATCSAPLPVDVVSIAGAWKFRVGDDIAWANPDLDDGSWLSIEVPTGWGPVEYDGPSDPRGWYRTTLVVPPERRDRLAIAMGPVDSAYELYANGRLVGSVGRLPPDPEEDYDRRLVVPVGADAIGADGRLVVAVRAWTNRVRSRAPGMYDGPIAIGPAEVLRQRELQSDLPLLILAAIFATIGGFHISLRWRGSEHLWFGAMAVAMAAYALLRSQFKYEIVDAFVLLKKIEHALLYFFAIAMHRFMWPVIGRRLGRVERGYQLANAVVGVAVTAWPGLYLNLLVLPLYEVTFVMMWAVSAIAVVAAIRGGNREARTLALGLVPVLAFGVHDSLLDAGFIVGPRLTPLGGVTLIFAMSATLSNRFRRTHTDLIALQRDLEERVADRTAALEDRTRELEEANQTKSRFLASVSHEVRTPINGILGVNRMLLQTTLDGRQQELGEIVQAQGLSLLAVVNDILDYSKMEAGRFELQPGTLSLYTLLRHTARPYEEQARANGVLFTNEIDAHVPDAVRGDPVRLRQVLDNLLSNAVKFTARGSIVLRAALLTGTEGSSIVRFEVEDSGIGLDDAAARQLFQPFTQADSSTSRRYGGTGLGLAIAKSLVEMMGGEIGCTGRPGGGSIFWFTARLEPADSVPEDVLVDVQPVSPPRRTVEATPLAVRHPRARGRVLIAEDHEVNRMVTVALLEEAGCEIRVAATGVEAVAACEAQAFDLVLMDCGMPEMDGYTATAHIRARERRLGARRTPIVALTAHALAGERERCEAAGMDDYVTKPAGPEILERVLERWLPGAAINPRMLDDLQLRSPEAVQTVVTHYLRATPDEIALLDTVLLSDRARAASLAHSLAGSALMVGAEGLAALFREISEHDGDVTDHQAAMQRVHSEYERVHEALSARLAAPVAPPSSG